VRRRGIPRLRDQDRAVTASLVVMRVTLRDIHPSARVLVPAMVVGLAVCASGF